MISLDEYLRRIKDLPQKTLVDKKRPPWGIRIFSLMVSLILVVCFLLFLYLITFGKGEARQRRIMTIGEWIHNDGRHYVSKLG